MTYIMPRDASTNSPICVASVNITKGNNGFVDIDIIEFLYINMKLSWLKQGWDMMGERGLKVDMKNDFYRESDIYNEQDIIKRLFGLDS